MIELHIYLEPLPGREPDLEEAYRRHYVPAVSCQPGFRRTALLRRRDAVRQYQIDIAFDSEELRLQWVASPEHQRGWPPIQDLCARVSWTGFDTVAL
jgi:heme-degrading monooxygenase HmoA